MPYMTTTDLETRVGTQQAAELTTESGSTPDATIMGETVDAALGEVDGYLARRYAVPVDLVAYPQVAGILKGVSLDIAVYRLHTRRQPAPEGIQMSRDKAIEWLLRVSRGDILLPAAAVPTATTADGPVSSYEFARDDQEVQDWL
jgi:phage gp36-like protein